MSATSTVSHLDTKAQPAAKFDKVSSSQKYISAFVGYGTVLLTFGIIFAFLVVPVGSVVIKAFVNQGEFTLEFFSLLFQNDLLMSCLYNSLMLACVTTVITTIMTLPLAIIQTKYDFPFKTFFSALLLTPLILPPFVGAIGFQRFFALHGSVNLWLANFGVEPIEWVSEERKFWVVAALAALHLYPIMLLNLTASLANVDPSLEEMAATLGVKKFKRFFQITWPLAQPGYIAGAIVVFIWAFTDLGTPLLIGFNDVLPVKIFSMVTEINENPVGYSLVCVVLVLTVLFFLLSKYIVGRKKYEMMAKGHVTSPVTRINFFQALPAYVILSAVIIAALIPHISVVITSISHKWFMTPLPEQYTLEYYQKIFQQELPLTGIKNSFGLASAATLFDVVIGVLCAYVITRKLVPFTQVLDSLVMIPLALPGIVLAFGYIVTFSGTALDPMHNPIPLLVIAYGIRRLPYMVRSASAGLAQTSQSLEEASFTFGASRFYTLRKITLPLLLANIIAGGLLCFAYAMLDVSDSMLLAMSDRFYPITKVIYSLYLEQGIGEFVSSALGTLTMLILGLCIGLASVILGKKMGELFKA